MRRRNGYELDSKNKIDKESQVPNIKIKEVSRKVSRLQNWNSGQIAKQQNTAFEDNSIYYLWTDCIPVVIKKDAK